MRIPSSSVVASHRVSQPKNFLGRSRSRPRSRSALQRGAVALSLSVAVLPAFAAGGTAGCERIVDVELPYEVELGADVIRFDDGGSPIVVSAAQVTFNGRTLADGPVAGYHEDLRGFLDNAGSMARVARSFLSRGAFPEAATAMCDAILAVHDSGQAMERRFPGFTSPVRVTLR
jgi:hypothetical protein